MINKCSLVLCVAASLTIGGTAIARNATPSPVVGAQADNTAMNKRDRSDGAITPFDQPNNKVDIALAAHVRKAIVGEKSLSTKAHNVKLIAASGVVTLRGPVDSADEKAAIDKVASSVDGVTRVDNQLDIKQ